MFELGARQRTKLGTGSSRSSSSSSAPSPNWAVECARGAGALALARRATCAARRAKGKHCLVALGNVAHQRLPSYSSRYNVPSKLCTANQPTIAGNARSNLKFQKEAAQSIMAICQTTRLPVP